MDGVGGTGQGKKKYEKTGSFSGWTAGGGHLRSGDAAHHHGGHGHYEHERVPSGMEGVFGRAGSALLVCPGFFDDIGILVFKSGTGDRHGEDADEILQKDPIGLVCVRSAFCSAGTGVHGEVSPP